MAIKITSTQETFSDIKLLVYGKSGAGKSRLIADTPAPVIVSSEKKALSLRGTNIPLWQVSSATDMETASERLAGKEGEKYKTICIDSISDLAELVLSECKTRYRDARKAYGEMNDICSKIIRKFRDIPGKHLYVIAKMAYLEDEFSGITTWQPSMPGKTLMVNLPYFFDLVFALREGKTKDGVTYTYLQTNPDVQYMAKGDRSVLNPMEKPHLGELFQKIINLNKR